MLRRKKILAENGWVVHGHFLSDLPSLRASVVAVPARSDALSRTGFKELGHYSRPDYPAVTSLCSALDPLITRVKHRPKGIVEGTLRYSAWV